MALLDRTRGSFAARAALTSATVATSADLAILSEIGRPFRSGDLPVAATVSETIERGKSKRVGDKHEHVISAISDVTIYIHAIALDCSNRVTRTGACIR